MRRSSAWLQGMALYCERMDAQEQCLAQGMALYSLCTDVQFGSGRLEKFFSYVRSF